MIKKLQELEIASFNAESGLLHGFFKCYPSPTFTRVSRNVRPDAYHISPTSITVINITNQTD